MATRFIFFGGKGGVGKTTCAAAYALTEAFRLSRSASATPTRALVVSTDPAHSLGDAFGVKLGARPARVARALDAVELDAPRAFARWLNAHRRALADVLEHGTWLDRADVDALLDLSVPGVDELVGLLEIHRLASAGYDVIVVDMAPTGHALRLLSAPETVAAVAGILDALEEEHRFIRQQLARVVRPEASDRLIALMAEQAAAASAMLRDGSRTLFHWVTLAEPLAIAESEDGVSALTRAGIAVSEIIINRVLPQEASIPNAADGPCEICGPRRASEREAVARIQRTLGRGRRVTIVPAALSEPRGVAALKRLMRDPATLRAIATSRVPATAARPATAGAFFTPLPAGRGAQLLFVGGKGGVGKTTVAAAIALHLARAMPRETILLLSTDPAHSLADVLGARVGDQGRTVRGAPRNLAVRELNAKRALDVKRAELSDVLGEAAESFGGSGGGAEQLMDLAPPGIDELFAMLEVLKHATGTVASDGVRSRHAYAAIVVDTAPTGHALRLLEMPDVAREWVQLLLRVLLKYKSLVRPGRLAAELVDVSRSIRELRTVMRDPARARFIVVTRAAGVPRAETERLIRRLHRMTLSIPAIVVNARTLAPGACRRCRATAMAEAREEAVLTRFVRTIRLRHCAIIDTPFAAPPPRGAVALDRWAKNWLV